MPKTQFSKGQLVQIHSILQKEKLLPCEKISVFTDHFIVTTIYYYTFC